MNEKFEKNFVIQCNQSITDSLTTYKGHFNVAARWRMVHLVLGCAVAACSFVAGASIIGEIKGIGIYITGVMGVLGGFIAAITTFLNPNKLSEIHKNAGADYKFIRDSLKTLVSIKLVSETNEAKLTKELEKLRREYAKLDKTYPVLPTWASNKASKGVEKGEASYDSD